MPAKKKQKSRKPHGHLCHICGECKPNEKFSGSGHAKHVCKQCQALPQAERNELIAVRKINNMEFRHLSESEIKWLRGKLNDNRPEASMAARAVHGFRFPHYERNKIKKGLTANSLEFFIHGEVWDEYGNEIPAHMWFSASNSGEARRIDYSVSELGEETSINIGRQEDAKFLKAVVHQLNAPFWSECLSSDSFDSPCLDILPEFLYAYSSGREEGFDWALYADADEGAEAAIEGREPVWQLKLVLTKGYGEKIQTFYNQVHHEPQELFWLLMELFDMGGEFESSEETEW